MDTRSGESEWMWLLIDASDDQRRLVFGKLDSEPRLLHEVLIEDQGLFLLGAKWYAASDFQSGTVEHRS